MSTVLQKTVILLVPLVNCTIIGFLYNIYTEPFRIQLIDDSPKVLGTNVTIDFQVNKAYRRIFCYVTAHSFVDCKFSKVIKS